VDILLEILEKILQDNKFATRIYGHEHVGAQYIDAHIEDDFYTRRISIWGDKNSTSQTQLIIESCLTYPRIDQGEDNVLAHADSTIEFAAPDSIEKFEKFIRKKLRPTVS
jgi:hypothetical protein